MLREWFWIVTGARQGNDAVLAFGWEHEIPSDRRRATRTFRCWRKVVLRSYGLWHGGWDWSESGWTAFRECFTAGKGENPVDWILTIILKLDQKYIRWMVDYINDKYRKEKSLWSYTIQSGRLVLHCMHINFMIEPSGCLRDGRSSRETRQVLVMCSSERCFYSKDTCALESCETMKDLFMKILFYFHNYFRNENYIDNLITNINRYRLNTY